MKKIIKTALATTVLASALTASAPAFADETPFVTVTGNVALTTEYRLRGISQTDGDPAIQGGLTVSTAPGFYVGAWASNLAGAGSFGGNNMELDLIAGYTKAVGPVTLDGGLIYYVYPGANGTPPGVNYDFFELYGSVSGKIGPVNAKLGTYWAPNQRNIAYSSAKGHNVWVYTDLGLPISGTPITLKGHVGYSSGNSGYTKDLDVVDYAVGADVTWNKLTLNVSYVGTDVSRANSFRWPSTATQSGHDITKGKVVATLSASF